MTQGPYRFVRNPMHVGAGLALVGAGLFYDYWSLVGDAMLLGPIVHAFVVHCEEPTLRRTFVWSTNDTASVWGVGGRGCRVYGFLHSPAILPCERYATWVPSEVAPIDPPQPP